MYGAPYEPVMYPDDARDWLLEQKKEIQSAISAYLDDIGLDDETQLNYEIDCVKKTVEELLTYLKNIDRASIEEMERLLGWDPECP